MIDSIHQSTLNMALRCGEQCRRRYIENEIIPPGIAAGRGTGVHKVNEVNLKQKVKSKKDLPLDDMKDAARDGFVYAFRNGVYIPKKNRPAKNKLLNDGLNDTIRCTEIYQEKVAEEIHPISIEEPFELDVGLELKLAGTMDYQEEPKVGDLKTSSSKWAADREKKEIQPILYSYVHEKTRGIRPEFKYHVLIARRGKDGQPTSTDYQPSIVNPSDSDYEALFAKMRMFIKMLNTGTFIPANPTSWWCSEDWCGYWYTCPYVGNSFPKKEI